MIRERKRASRISRRDLVRMIGELRGLLYQARDERLDQAEIDAVLDRTSFDNDLDMDEKDRDRLEELESNLLGNRQHLLIEDELRAVLEGQDFQIVSWTYATISNDPDTLIVERAIITRPTRRSPAAKAIEQERLLQERVERIKYIGETEGRIPRVKDDS